jgi:dethiobiotin synthetase
MAPIVFITGTDTGVGKTIFTGFFTGFLRSKEIDAVAMKPVATGSREDIEFLQNFQASRFSTEMLNPWFFPEPLAPGMCEQNNLRLIDLIEKIKGLAGQVDCLLVEGAGGLEVPLAKGLMISGLIESLAPFGVILVARNALGTINHSLLSIQRLKALGVTNLQLILVDQEKPDSSSEKNLNFLQNHTGETVLRMPFYSPIAKDFTGFSEGSKIFEKSLARSEFFDKLMAVLRKKKRD